MMCALLWAGNVGVPPATPVMSVPEPDVPVPEMTVPDELAPEMTVPVMSAPEPDAPTPDAIAPDEPSREALLADYQALSASQSRNYDRAQDISPRQMLLLLEVCERTGASLGQKLATGEHESAHTWNDHVRPTLRSGSLGSASGVWQFLPSTFQTIIERFGTQLLALSEADLDTGREHLDLGDGPFSDAQVRALIQETVDGKRGADDEELKLLRHNFAVLAFAKHYLSVDSGATTPEEDYLFHFLGEGQGRRILALARGEARHTLSVKQPPPPPPLIDETPTELADADDGVVPLITAAALARDEILTPAERRLPSLSPQPSPARVSVQWMPVSALSSAALDDMIASVKARSAALERPMAFEPEPDIEPAPAIFVPPRPPPPPPPPPPISSEWGFDAESPVVTGNLGMFYRDGKGQTKPYTWGEFMDHLARRVRAKEQPAMVRAKYGVGFALAGGDMPERAFSPEFTATAATFRHDLSGAVRVPEALITGPLGPDETRQYKQRLATLIQQGEDQPLDTLPPEAQTALRHLAALPPDLADASTAHPEVSNALNTFRKLVGKHQPDDPANLNRLMPAERIALELYDQRLARLAALQAAQLAAIDQSVDLSRIKTLPVGLRNAAAPHVSLLQVALAERGLLKQPTEKHVWRDKNRKKQVTYTVKPFVGYAGEATQAAIKSFQWRHGLRDTQSVLDPVTLGLLGLPPMGPDIFRPLAGPNCPIDPAESETFPASTIPTGSQHRQPLDVIAPHARLARKWEWPPVPVVDAAAPTQEPPSP